TKSGNRMLTRMGRGLGVFAAIVASAYLLAQPLLADALPVRLSDQEFWRLSSTLSEPDGTFRSDNLVSNEVWLQYVITDLLKTARPAGVYRGVGPEQNSTYIAALSPPMAFIIDVRRGNLDVQLMYKALFEASGNRGEFVSRLFSRPKPDGIDERSTAADIFEALSHVERSQSMFDDTLRMVKQNLVDRHQFPLASGEWSAIENTFDVFSTFGPNINYWPTGTDDYGGALLPSYTNLMTATDRDGIPHSYLNSEDAFRTVKDLEARNLIVPLVGDFAGPKAIRAVGTYLRGRSM